MCRSDPIPLQAKQTKGGNDSTTRLLKFEFGWAQQEVTNLNARGLGLGRWAFRRWMAVHRGSAMSVDRDAATATLAQLSIQRRKKVRTWRRNDLFLSYILGRVLVLHPSAPPTDESLPTLELACAAEEAFVSW